MKFKDFFKNLFGSDEGDAVARSLKNQIPDTVCYRAKIELERNYAEYPTRIRATNSWLISVREKIEGFQQNLQFRKSLNLSVSQIKLLLNSTNEIQELIEKSVEALLMASDEFSVELEKALLELHEKLKLSSQVRVKSSEAKSQLKALEDISHRVLAHLVYLKSGSFPETEAEKIAAEKLYNMWRADIEIDRGVTQK